MEYESFIKLVKECLRFGSYSISQQEHMEAFLRGETDELVDVPEYKSRGVYYEFYRKVKECLQNEDMADTARRAMQLLAEICGDGMADLFRYQDDIFQQYFLAGIKQNIVKKDIWYRARECALLSHNSALLNRLQNQIRQIKESRKTATDLAQAFTYYEGLIEEELQNEDGNDVSYFILKLLARYWFAGESTKQKQYDVMTEEALFSLLKTSASRTGLSYAFMALSKEASALLENAKVMDAALSPEYQKRIALVVSYLLMEEKEIYKEAFHLAASACLPDELYAWLGLSMEKLSELLTELPLQMRIKFFAAGIFMEAYDKELTKGAERLLACYQENPGLFVQCLSQYTQQKKLPADVFSLYFVLHREGNPEAEKAQDAYLRYLKEQQSLLCLKNQGQWVNDFAILLSDKEQDHYRLDYKQMNLQYFFEYGLINAFKATMLLFAYSEAAKTMLGIFLRRMLLDNDARSCIAYFFVTGNTLADPGRRNLFSELSQTADIQNVMLAYAEKAPGIMQAEFGEFVKAHLKDAEAVFSTLYEQQDEKIIAAASVFYAEDLGLPYEALSKVLKHRQKTVLSAMESFFGDKERYLRPYVEKVKGDKNTKEAVNRILKFWDRDRTAEELNRINDLPAMTAYVKERYDAKGKSKIPYEELFLMNAVREKSSEVLADKVLMQYYIKEYMLLTDIERVQTCEKIRTLLREEDIKALFSAVYQQWLTDGADTKIKNLVIPYALHAGVKEITELKKAIDQFTENARGALGAFLTGCLGLNGSNIALLLIHGMSKKYKNKQVKAAAEAAMEAASLSLGISKEELGDRIVPSLGFSKNREIVYAYGSRKFIGRLTGKLDVLLYDETGKQIKSLPKPSAKDDIALASASEAAYKDLKKELKVVLAAQKDRLFDAVLTGRLWERKKWEALFVENPIMNSFAIGLIWEELNKDGECIGTFRYMEDGSYTSSEEDIYTLAEESKISLLHPLDAPEELIAAWKTQLLDYEIVQPVSQLDIPVYSFTEEELSMQQIHRYEGKKVYFGTIRSVMEKYNFKRTSVVDAGGFDGYYYEDPAAGLGVQILFDMLYIGMAPDETAAIKTLEFYRADSLLYGSYVYDSITNETRILPRALPKKFASFALMAAEKMVEKLVK